jgi:hypothetical protein
MRSPTQRKRRPSRPDGRTTGARRHKAIVAAFEGQIGGELTAADRALIQQAALLSLRVEQLTDDAIAGRSVDDSEIIRLAGASRRALAAISAKAIDRKPAVQSLAAYWASKQAATDQPDDDDGEDDGDDQEES